MSDEAKPPATADLSPRPPTLPKPASDEEIRWLVMAMVDDKVWTTLDAPKAMAGMMFLPLTFGALHGWPRALLDQIVVFAVAEHHHMLPMSINGCPIFTELSMWRREDFERAMLAAAQVTRAQKAALDKAVPAAEAPAEEP